jgi:beta-lactamase superfamily II metal-dependent hydrolase
MPIIHFLNVLHGDCNIIQHENESKRVTVIDVSNAYDETDSEAEKAVKAYKEQIKHITKVPEGKKDFKQKEFPDNPITYLKNLNIKSIHRFIITHPDMDHLDGIEDFYSKFEILNTWDTDNNKVLDKKPSGGRYNPNDWNYYTQIRDGKYTATTRHSLTAGAINQYWNEDHIKILCPTADLIKQANSGEGDFNEVSYVLLYTPPKKNGGHWKILFAGDSHDSSWDYILKNYHKEVSNVDVLLAPHHGRDSNRSYEFLNTLKPRLTLMGNASSSHLAYTCYPRIRITNNQAGYVILDISEDGIQVYVKNKEFALWFRQYSSRNRNWGEPSYSAKHKAYFVCQLPA